MDTTNNDSALIAEVKRLREETEQLRKGQDKERKSKKLKKNISLVAGLILGLPIIIFFMCVVAAVVKAFC